MPKIMENIERVGKEMALDDAVSRRIRSESVAALVGGKNSEAWGIYMKNFGTGQQLQRLLGKDDAFNESEDADNILAYVVAAGPCTVTTMFLSIARGMPKDFAMRLDDGVTGDE
jgi:hypothetical protein